ncbi:hypothetical protein Vadar_030128 [Vaccinium darrowii]|uniref:Uncharacterized protein n=1 Tax=Vaccinium darrowii TaxID=229202 RepID=A0ACB7Z097_9ERIC|nr:hypothetical protein Vadar_030128 [Vaccinium darrowii]
MVCCDAMGTKTTEGLSGAKLQLVDRPKADNVPTAREKSVPIEGIRSRKKNSVDATLRDVTVDKDSGQDISRKRKKSAENVTEITESKVGEDSSVAAEITPPSKKQSKSRTRSNVDLKKVSGPPSTTKRPKVEEGTDGPKNKKPRKGEQASETPFRSSLGGLVTFVKELNLRECHKEVLKKTPFWGIFEAIMDNRVTNGQCRKSDKLIIEIIESYDPKKDKFRLGKTYLEITKADMVRVFGINCGDEHVSLRSGCRDAIKFVARREIEETRMTTTSVKQLLIGYVLKDELEYVEDVARLLCLFLFHTFFFPHWNYGQMGPFRTGRKLG